MSEYRIELNLYGNLATSALKDRPRCDICQDPAIAEAKTIGPWGYFCEEHWLSLCAGRLGLGKGQILLCGDDLDNHLRIDILRHEI